jgi:tetratricopeptide repeat protein 30
MIWLHLSKLKLNFRYLPILTAQAKIYWDMGNYEFVEKILRQQQVEDYYNDNPTWKINLGHAYFIQETNFKEAIRYYKDVYSNTYDILSIPASVIANLCVSLIMVQRNEDAQDIIKRVEEEEIKALSENPDRQVLFK